MRGLLLLSLIFLVYLQYAAAQWFKYALNKGTTCEDLCKRRKKMCKPLDEFRNCKCFPQQMIANGLQLPVDPLLVCRMNWAGVVPKCCDLYKQQEDSKNSQSEMSSRINNQSREIDQLKTRLASYEQDAEARNPNTTAEMRTLLEQNVNQNKKLEQLEKMLANQHEEMETSLANQRGEIGQLETILSTQREEIGQLETRLANQHEEMETSLANQREEIGRQLETRLSNQREEMETRIGSEQGDRIRIYNLTTDALNALGEKDVEMASTIRTQSQEIRELCGQNHKQSQDIEQLRSGLNWEHNERMRLSNMTVNMVNSLGEQNQDIEALTQAWSSELWNKLEATVSASGSIGFTALLVNDVKFPQPGTLKFDKVLLNDGGGYDPKTGYFTVPDAGTYSFTISIYGTTQKSGDGIHAFLNVNNAGKNGGYRLFVSIPKTNPGWTQTTNSVLLRLRKGDLINVVCLTGLSGKSRIISTNKTSFTGFHVHK